MENYEKKYKEALERAEALIAGETNTSDTLFYLNDIKSIFPELAESEDERIRKALINLFKIENFNGYTTLNGIDVDDVIAWLEKQNEQKEYTFKSLPRLLEMVEPTERAKAYCQKLIDTLVKEGYFTDAKIVGECLKQMNGEKVALATMDNQKINKSEDEMIIKELISFVSNDGWKFTKLTKEEKKSWIAWLKKQCQKSTSEIIKEYFANTSKEQLDKDWEELKHLNDVGITIEECNETKFHEGDWIVNNNSGGVCQVTEIRDDEYCLWPLDAEIMGYLRIIDVDNDYHLWTIEDAKDGDILFQDLMEGKTFIFDGINSDMAILYSFIINNDSKDVLPYDIGKPNTGIGTIKENKNIIHPATKEQRDLLFSKMKEVDYEWDADKKELKKIVQKSAWSEDDEVKINRIAACLENLNVADNDILLKDVDWLKSLKQKYVWKPSDEQMKALKEACDENWEPDGLDPLYELYEQLKKIKENKL